MKIIIDNKIPFIEGVFEPVAEVVYLPGHLITAEAAHRADALITRTRTICDRETLEGTTVSFIATATAGFDHIDTDYCESAGIEWVNAPGCNAESVNQYLASALFSFSARENISLENQTVGIVGVGQAGARVAKTCETLGMKVLLNDPPRERIEGSSAFVSLQAVQQQADIITFHVPLNHEGVDKTFHMVSGKFLRGLKKKPLLINTCRGEVFDTEAVCRARKANGISGLIIDCWEHEPYLDPGLLNLADFGTPHIAGYSRDGKANGTKVSVRAVSQFFSLGLDGWAPSGIEPPERPVIELDGSKKCPESILAEAVLASYEIDRDDRILRDHPRLFEQFRGDYPVRREFAAHSIKAIHTEVEVLEKLEKLGFRVTR